VYSVEIIDELAQRAIRRLKRQGYTNVEARIGNGYAGWPNHAPFDKVMVTAAPDLIPPPLINQLKAGGRMGYRSVCPLLSSLSWSRKT
jgi:protein-L-isoaspartate(D-aspartate) O-methyltransferase